MTIKRIRKNFLNPIRERKAKNKLKKFVKSPSRGMYFTLKKGLSVGCIIDFDIFRNPQQITTILKGSIQPYCGKIYIYGYTSNIKKLSEENAELLDPQLGFEIVSDKDYLNIGNKKGAPVFFVKKNFDLLINYFEGDKLPLLLMGVHTNAKLRVGSSKTSFSYNDIIINVSLSQPELFAQEIKKYISILNKS